MALSQALEPALLAGLGADGTSVVPIPTAPAVGGVWAKAAAGDGERARLIALALQRSKEQLKAFGVAEDSLVIDVTDNGIGIDAAEFQRIFFPGYTTRTEGTGLGLHSAANYVIGAGGTITPLSRGVGRGATMRIAWRLGSILPAGNGNGEPGWSRAGQAGTT